MVLAQNQICRTVKHKILIYIYIKALEMVIIRLLARMPKIYYGERTALSTNGAGETGFLQAK